MKAAILVLAMCAMTFSAERAAHAVPNPQGIAWTAPPAAFVTSLYTSVLGRAPESAAVVSAWSAQVTATPASRLRVFWNFVGSPEYRGTSWARQRPEYTLYVKYDVRSNRNLWVASKGPLGADYYGQAGPFTFGVAMALRNYHATFAPHR